MFGAGGKDKGMPTTGQAIQKLRETEEMLIKKQEFLEKKIDQELDIAKKNGTKNKRGMFIYFSSNNFILLLLINLGFISCNSGIETEKEV